MAKINRPVTPTSPASRHAPEKVKGVSKQLAQMKNKTTSYMEKKGLTFLGAGKPPSISFPAPQRSSNRVAQATAAHGLLRSGGRKAKR